MGARVADTATAWVRRVSVQVVNTTIVVEPFLADERVALWRPIDWFKVAAGQGVVVKSSLFGQAVPDSAS